MDMSGINPPKMDWDSSNLPETWEKFERHVKLIFQGPLKDKTDEERLAYLLIWVDDKGRDVQQSWKLEGDDEKSLDKHYENFRKHVRPTLNPVFARYKFNNETQGTDTIDKFVTRLRLSARDCRFGDKEDELIRDRIVFGTNNAKIREKLINQGENLTLTKAIQIAQNSEYCQKQLASMNIGTNDSTNQRGNVDAIKRANNQRKQLNRTKQQYQGRPDVNNKTRCGNCGQLHDKSNRSKCPAYGKTCHKCKKANHFKKMCRSKEVHGIVMNSDVDSYVQDDSDIGACGSNYDLGYSIDTVGSSSHHQPDRALVSLLIGPKQQSVQFKLDTGSAVNIISCQIFNSLRLTGPLEPPDSKLTSYSGNMIPVLGKVQLHCRYKAKDILTTFYVVDTAAPPLLGFRSCIDLGLIQLTYSVDMSTPADTTTGLTKQVIMTKHADLFQGVGKIPGKCKLHVKEGAVPVVNAPRRVPEALKSRLQQELNRMEKDRIITRVTEPTDWVNSIVVVEKPKTGKLRVCLDPKALNSAICRPHYPMPTLDDVTANLAGASHFSILDITHAYWSIELDKESSMLTTFSTPFGRYRYLRLPFGISASSDIFNQKVQEIFQGIPGVYAIVDDILISGRSQAEHDTNLCATLQRAKEKCIKFNPDKCKIGVKEVPFFGHILSVQGLKPDPSKVKAITQLEIPDCRKKLEMFLGLANYLGKFAPNLAEVTSPLRKLLQKDAEFVFDEPQTQAFNEVKRIITNAPVLGYFDPSKQLVIECDSSQNGTGCCLMQDGKPIAYASKTLTQTEKMYAQIEKELLAILFSCKRFHQYTYGRDVIVHSDHKPLASIMLKPLSAAAPRLQRMLLQLSKYRLTVKHIKGKDIPVSDFLSRNSLTDTMPNLMEGLDLHVHTVRKQLFVTNRRLDSIRNAIKQDRSMQTLKKTILEGWPENRSNCPQEVIEFWNHRDELSVEESLIFRGQKLVIPPPLRPEMLVQVHTGHLGVTKTLERAKDNMFWPGMAKQITDYVLRCQICLKHRDSNAKEPLISHEFPSRPFQKIGTDIFQFDGKQYLVTIDYYSRFFELDWLPDTRAVTVIKKLKTHLSRYGICDICISDNGPQFVSKEFTDFAHHWNFEHKTSSPYFPRSNGLAEKSVSIAKRLLLKAKECEQDPYISLLEYRNTPLDCGYTPAQLMMGRRTKSILPITENLLKPQTIPPSVVIKKETQSKSKQKEFYDRNSKPLPPFKVNDSVRIQFGKVWEPGKIVQKHDQRSYSVVTQDGSVYRRNRQHLMKTSENFSHFGPMEINILSNQMPQSSNPVSSGQIPVNTNPTLQEKSSQGPYVTRSGRVVKENERYSGDQWVK